MTAPPGTVAAPRCVRGTPAAVGGLRPQANSMSVPSVPGNPPADTLEALQRVADENGGNRAAPDPGSEASVAFGESAWCSSPRLVPQDPAARSSWQPRAPSQV